MIGDNTTTNQKNTEDAQAPEVQNESDTDQKIKELEERSQEYLGLAQRARADYENLKKDTERWKDDFIKFANEMFFLELIPILDNFADAMKHIPESDKTADWVVGIVYIKKQLEDILKKQGAEAYGEIGDSFDVQIHEAIEEVHDPEHQPGTIVKIVRSGYRLRGKVLRAAQAVIAK